MAHEAYHSLLLLLFFQQPTSPFIKWKCVIQAAASILFLANWMHSLNENLKTLLSVTNVHEAR